MKIADELQKQLDLLDKYDNAYYNGQAIVSDSTYDLLKDRVFKQLPPDHPRLSKIGHSVCSAWPKEKHAIHMGSQNKVTNEDEIRAWIQKTLKALGVKSADFVVQHKIDGFSMSAQYENGKMTRCLSRGDGVIGENFTPNARLFRDMPRILPVSKMVICRGEGVILKNDFDAIQKKTGNKFKNPRNAASGISRRLDGAYSQYIRFIAYDINAHVKLENEKIEVLKKLGFSTVPSYICHSVNEVIAIYNRVKDKERNTYPYDIDGLVLKLDSLEFQDRLGVERGCPVGQVAMKFGSDQAITKLKGIFVQVGRSGKLTPVAVLEPVDLMGSTIVRASLHNFDYIDQSGIGPGAEVTIEKMGDIIPQVVDIVVPGSKYYRPDKCPSCGGSLEWDGVNLWCRAKVCRERDINKIVYWIETLGMKGFSGKFVEKLWDLDKVRSVSDLYRLKEDDFLSVDGMGEKTIKNFFETIKNTSEMMLEKFITGLGIESCSKSTAGILVENFHTWDKIASIKPEDLQKLPGFAEVSSVTICNGIGEVKDLADDLLRVIKIKKKKQGPLTGVSVCVTGLLESMGRKEFYDMVVEKGGVVKDNVTEGLTYLVTNDVNSGSSKNEQAKKKGVKIISEKDFLKLLGDEAPKKEEPKRMKIQIESQKLF